ncbi:hypothetical protein TEA_006783 [Camellia sinensis var. sinensis]|uniref:Uncharacterized protein n=1 Tax=Camellia sinensis var. sinensis TaxID=542762 RepID=A0A4S4D5P5_CAMSN|nr:hypothetical protein TEA_006783 [Camellia sinensis var. sinensis]
MCKCRSHGTFSLFGLQSSHLNICYYHQDPHQRSLRTGSPPRFRSHRCALLLIGAWRLPRRSGTGRALKGPPFSGLVDSAVSLRASTRVSSGFTPLRHSSPSFGSQQACSHLNPSQKIKISRQCNPRWDPVSQLLYALRVYSPVDSHTYQTPWSVFQDGPNGELVGRRRERADAEARPRARAASHNRDEGVSAGFSTARALASASIRTVPRPESIGGPTGRRSTSDRGASLAPIRFPPDNFKHSLTLFSKSFSSFPRGSGHDRAITLSGAPFLGTWARSAAEDASPDYNSNDGVSRFSSWALPGSLAVTRGILRLGGGVIGSRQASRDGPDAREATQRFVNHHSSRRVVRRGGLAFGPLAALLPPFVEGREGVRVTQRETPRQTCPQPNGFGRNLRSKTRWFAGFCNSHQVSHFATFFINARAEISVAESRLVFLRDAALERALFVRVPWRYSRRGLLFRRGMAPAAPEGAPGALPTGRGSDREGADGPPPPFRQRGKIT